MPHALPPSFLRAGRVAFVLKPKQKQAAGRPGGGAPTWR